VKRRHTYKKKWCQ